MTTATAILCASARESALTDGAETAVRTGEVRRTHASRTTTRRRRRRRPAGAAAIGALVLAGCGGSEVVGQHRRAGDAGPCGTTDDTTLTVGLFGTFGFKEAGLWDAYKKVCPNITIKEDVVEQSADYWTRLKTRLASGSGLDDVQAIEIGFVADVVQNHADQFVNWNNVPNAATLTRPSSSPGSGSRPAAPTARPRSGSAPTSARRRSATAATCSSRPGSLRPGDAGKTEWATWDDFINFGKQYEASSTKQAGLALRRQRRQHLLDRRLPGRQRLRQRRRRGRRRGQRRRRGRPGTTRRPGGAGRHHRRARAVLARPGTRPSATARSRRSPARPG